MKEYPWSWNKRNKDKAVCKPDIPDFETAIRLNSSTCLPMQETKEELRAIDKILRTSQPMFSSSMSYAEPIFGINGGRIEKISRNYGHQLLATRNYVIVQQQGEYVIIEEIPKYSDYATTPRYFYYSELEY